MERILPVGSRAFFACRTLMQTGRNVLFITDSEQAGRRAKAQAEFFLKKQNNPQAEILYLPSLPASMYEQIAPPEQDLSSRAEVLAHMVEPRGAKMLITPAASLLYPLPSCEMMKSSVTRFKVGQKINVEDVIARLTSCGYRASDNANFAGEFARRGEIIDIVTPPEEGYRIYLDFDNIESIKRFDITSQLSGENLEEIKIIPASEIIINEKVIKEFSQNLLQKFGVGISSSLQYQQIISGVRPLCAEYMSKLLYAGGAGLMDYMGAGASVIYDDFACAAGASAQDKIKDEYRLAREMLQEKSQQKNNLFLMLQPQEIANMQDILPLSSTAHMRLSYGDSDFAISSAGLDITTSPEKKDDKIASFLDANQNKIIVVFCDSEIILKQAENHLKDKNLPFQKIDNITRAQQGVINLAHLEIEYGFASGENIFLSHNALFPPLKNISAQKPASVDSKKRLENILLELDNFAAGSLVTHSEHGIGQFLGVENIKAGNIRHDCIKILYGRGDKLYIPVESIDLIKKYSDDPDAHELDRMGSTSWSGRKKKIRDYLKNIARDLIKISAKRKMLQATPVIIEDDAYDKFCAKFDYTPTQDQTCSIDDIRQDLLSGTLMDRLLCGDVGFGKTEVAMRAVHLAAADLAQDCPQVAILVPTTVLCRQHYNSFASRFAGSSIKIAELSRNIKPLERKQVIANLESGKVQIVIATHALLSEKIKFKNLRLLIIDEEQRFGVKQKEFIKNIKNSVHVLALSATPIPRTMQMSMTGIKELSLIATPPGGRLAVKSAVTPENSSLLRAALIKEHRRGGLSFYVCPKIRDIPDVERILQKIVPELKFKIMHGRMKPQEIDDILQEFARQEFDILLSTTIIESGLDIKQAGTLIVHNADRMGLSQLYQLRGRVGRGHTQAFAYFTVQPSIMNIKSKMQKLEIIRNMNTLGSGFTLASHDMNLRGFGNLVGQEQSGHIKEIGSEMYQEMLNDEIAKIKNEKSSDSKDISPVIKLPLPVFIPESYIQDENLRLSIYRRSASLTSEQEIEDFKFEMQDRFGCVPDEFDNLLKVIGLKILCSRLSIIKLDAGPKGFLAEFTDNLDAAMADRLLQLCQKNPYIKMRPPSSIFFAAKTQGDDLMQNLKKLLDLIG